MILWRSDSSEEHYVSDLDIFWNSKIFSVIFEQSSAHFLCTKKKKNLTLLNDDVNIIIITVFLYSTFKVNFSREQE